MVAWDCKSFIINFFFCVFSFTQSKQIGKVDENVDVSGNISYDYTVNFIGDNSQ